MTNNSFEKNLLEYREYLKRKEEPSYQITPEDRRLIYAITSDRSLEDMNRQISSASDLITKQKIIDYQLAKLRVEKVKEDKIKEQISKEFKINIDQIDQLHLSSGIYVFSFVDNLGRRRVFENSEDTNLGTQLEKDSKDNKLAQYDDPNKNSTNLIEKKANDNQFFELKLIDIEEYMANPDKVYLGNDEKKIRETKELISKIIKNKDTNEFKYINIENHFAITKQGKIVESFYIDDEVALSTPDVVQTKAKEVESSPESNEEPENEQEEVKEEQIEAPSQNLDEDELISGELAVRNLNVPLEDAKEKIKRYSESGDALLQDEESGIITPEEAEAYRNIIDAIERKKQMQKEKTNSLVLTPNGFVNILLITSVLTIIGIIVYWLIVI